MLEAAFAPKTLKAYHTGLHCFSRFLQHSDLTPQWPPNIEHVTRFIAHLSLNKYSPASARLYIAGIGYNCKRLNVTDITQNFIVKKMLLGLDKLSKTADSRLPVTPYLLDKILDKLPSVCSSTYESCMFTAAFSLAYFGLFRVGELVADSAKNYAHALHLNDVRVINHGSCLEVDIRRAKSDQKGKGNTLLLEAIPSRTCPVSNLRAFLKVRGIGSALLFCHFGGAPVTRYQFSAVMDKALRLIGLGDKTYRSHSFRIGAASVASELGLSDDEVKDIGRWKSKAYKQYIRIPTRLLAGKTIEAMV